MEVGGRNKCTSLQYCSTSNRIKKFKSALPTNIRLGRKWVTDTNVLAYNALV
jgi:hypothetical protein